MSDFDGLEVEKKVFCFSRFTTNKLNVYAFRRLREEQKLNDKKFTKPRKSEIPQNNFVKA